MFPKKFLEQLSMMLPCRQRAQTVFLALAPAMTSRPLVSRRHTALLANRQG